MATPVHWVLHGGTITVHYNETGPGHLHYVDGPFHKTFTGPSEIHVVPVPSLGRLVWVTLAASGPAVTDFTVLLPIVEVDAAHPIEPVHTDGIITHRLLLPLLGQKEHYNVHPLVGTGKL